MAESCKLQAALTPFPLSRPKRQERGRAHRTENKVNLTITGSFNRLTDTRCSGINKMKNVIKMFVAVAVMSVMAGSVLAQGAGPGGGAKAGGGQHGPGGPGGPGGGMRRGGMMSMDTDILAKLGLNPKQTAAVKTLKEATKAKMDAFRKSFTSATGGAGAGKAGERPKPTDAQKAQGKAIRDGYHSGLAKILTPTQMMTYDKEMKAMMEKMKAQFGGGKGPGGPEGAGKGKGKGTPPPTP